MANKIAVFKTPMTTCSARMCVCVCVCAHERLAVVLRLAGTVYTVIRNHSSEIPGHFPEPHKC